MRPERCRPAAIGDRQLVQNSSSWATFGQEPMPLLKAAPDEADPDLSGEGNQCGRSRRGGEGQWHWRIMGAKTAKDVFSRCVS